MNAQFRGASNWFWNLDPLTRQTIFLIAFAPVVFWFAGDPRDGFVMWSIIVASGVLPGIVVRALLEPVDGIDPLNAKHPKYRLVTLIYVTVALLSAIMIVALDRTIPGT